jgi:hypothetical protein
VIENEKRGKEIHVEGLHDKSLHLRPASPNAAIMLHLHYCNRPLQQGYPAIIQWALMRERKREGGRGKERDKDKRETDRERDRRKRERGKEKEESNGPLQQGYPAIIQRGPDEHSPQWKMTATR